MVMYWLCNSSVPGETGGWVLKLILYFFKRKSLYVCYRAISVVIPVNTVIL